MSEKHKKYFYINSVERGLSVLELLAEKQTLSVTEVAKHLGLNRSGSHRFLATLRELGYVEKDNNSRYQLTFKVLQLGMKFANRFEIRNVARPYMQRLALISKETINLGYWDGKGIIRMDKIDSYEILRIDPGIGTRVPAYCTGLGKSVLASLPDEELEEYLNSVKLESHTPKTITTRRSLEEELRKTRERGYAIDDEELAQGLRCVGAPVFDYKGYPLYSMSVSGPAMRLNSERIEGIQKHVRDICMELSNYLGCKAPVQQSRSADDREKLNGKSKVSRKNGEEKAFAN
jgi:IclR family transcriptional regulator, KDG regulon repressor